MYSFEPDSNQRPMDDPTTLQSTALPTEISKKTPAPVLNVVPSNIRKKHINYQKRTRTYSFEPDSNQRTTDDHKPLQSTALPTELSKVTPTPVVNVVP